MDDWLSGIYQTYPFLAVVGPLAGLLTERVKAAGKLAGFGLLAANVAVVTLVVVALGVAEAWDPAGWRKAPIAVLISVAVSNLVSTTLEHLTRKPRA